MIVADGGTLKKVLSGREALRFHLLLTIVSHESCLFSSLQRRMRNPHTSQYIVRPKSRDINPPLNPLTSMTSNISERLTMLMSATMTTITKKMVIKHGTWDGERQCKNRAQQLMTTTRWGENKMHNHWGILGTLVWVIVVGLIVSGLKIEFESKRQIHLEI
jgi:hypothetical protein